MKHIDKETKEVDEFVKEINKMVKKSCEERNYKVMLSGIVLFEETNEIRRELKD